MVPRLRALRKALDDVAVQLSDKRIEDVGPPPGIRERRTDPSDRLRHLGGTLRRGGSG